MFFFSFLRGSCHCLQLVGTNSPDLRAEEQGVIREGSTHPKCYDPMEIQAQKFMCKSVLLVKESEERCKLQSCVVSADPKAGNDQSQVSQAPCTKLKHGTERNCYGPMAPLPCPSSAFSCSSLFFHQSPALTVPALYPVQGCFPQRHRAGKGMKGDKSP